MKDNQQLSRKELYNYDEKLKSNFLELFLNYSELSRKYDLPYERIRLIRKREVWKHI